MSRRNVGRVFASERLTFPDPVGGVEITQLTNHKGHSRHLYFTEPGWYDEGRKLIFVSDRENRTNIYGVDLASGKITQLTDLDPSKGTIQKVSKSWAKDEIYFCHGDDLLAVDLPSLEERKLYTRPEGFVRGATNSTADGKYVCTYHVKDPSEQLRPRLGNDYPRYREYIEGRKGPEVNGIREMVWETHPLSMIVKIAVDGSGSEVVFQESSFMGHVNTSPTLPNILTFCHEGPWNRVENRIWGLDLETGRHWAIRPNAPDEQIGHEYWMTDGRSLGYHGRTPNGPIYGAIGYDNSDRVEAPFAFGSQHFHSLDLNLIVGDGVRGDPHLLLWRYNEGRFEGPKVLALHLASRHMGYLHVHPCFSPDGSHIVYTSDPRGYGQIFMVPVPDFDSMPNRSDL